MEERYDDDTVELIDYLRVMWWGKWIILGCLVVAVGLSALLVGLQPTPTTTYSGSTAILLREYVTAALAGDHDAAAAMISAVGFTLATVETAVPGIAASVAADRITLLRSNAASTDAVGEALVQAQTILEQQLPLTLAEELDHLAKTMQLEQTSLVAQLEILRRRLSEEGRVSTEDPVLEELAGRIVELEAQLAQHQVYLDTLETAEPSDLFVLSPMGGEPTITITASEARNRKTTIAIAGFLGLMLGVLLTFFVHYLLQVRERERHTAKDESSL